MSGLTALVLLIGYTVADAYSVAIVVKIQVVFESLNDDTKPLLRVSILFH